MLATRSASAQQYDDEGGYGGEGGYDGGGGGAGADDSYYAQDNLYHDYAMRQQQKEDKAAGYVLLVTRPSKEDNVSCLPVASHDLDTTQLSCFL